MTPEENEKNPEPSHKGPLQSGYFYNPYTGLYSGPPSNPQPGHSSHSQPFQPFQPFAPSSSSAASSRLTDQQEETGYNWKTPLLLYTLTWLTTYWAGTLLFGAEGLLYSLGIMTILTFHEMGHFLQTIRYRVDSSLPFFIPMPIGPFGTMGAIIRMDGRIPNLRALFDIGISGPLAGLVPSILFCYFGIALSQIGPKVYDPSMPFYGEPLLFHWFVHGIYGVLPDDLMLHYHPIAYAGWVGLFLTSLNLLPIGQLDGGHIFYGLFRKKAGLYSMIFFYACIILVFIYQLWIWTLMLLLLAFLGTEHPPTQDDAAQLGWFRKLLGVMTLAFVFIGFTPNPLPEHLPQQVPTHYVVQRDFNER
ncbi:MAG: site-2 protease family protein [Thermoguttaceae bacterium]